MGLLRPNREIVSEPLLTERVRTGREADVAGLSDAGPHGPPFERFVRGLVRLIGQGLLNVHAVGLEPDSVRRGVFLKRRDETPDLRVGGERALRRDDFR